MKNKKKLAVAGLIILIVGLVIWYLMRSKGQEQQFRTDGLADSGNGLNIADINTPPPPPPSTPTSTNPCDNMDGRKPGGHRWKCAEGRRRGLVIPSSANLRGYPEGNILAWMYHIKYESSWPERNSMSMKELAEAAAYQRMKQLGDG